MSKHFCVMSLPDRPRLLTLSAGVHVCCRQRCLHFNDWKWE